MCVHLRVRVRMRVRVPRIARCPNAVAQDTTREKDNASVAEVGWVRRHLHVLVKPVGRREKMS